MREVSLRSDICWRWIRLDRDRFPTGRVDAERSCHLHGLLPAQALLVDKLLDRELAQSRGTPGMLGVVRPAAVETHNGFRAIRRIGVIESAAAKAAWSSPTAIVAVMQTAHALLDVAAIARPVITGLRRQPHYKITARCRRRRSRR